ncbi:MAG TPA: NAD(P)/FAD-dependent oxidoreductase [Nocardioidaceae bacterium]
MAPEVELLDEHIAGDEAIWAEAIQFANIPTLLMVLVHMTGDLKWLDDPYRPSRTRGLDDNDTGGLPDEVQDEVRAAALETILAWSRGKPLAITEPSDELLVRMLSVSVGYPIDAEYAPLITNELSLGKREAAPVQVPEGFRVLIIGAGISGLCAGVRLQAAGIPFSIVERNDHVGGTWFENRYPGCGVDTPSYLYSFPFARARWSHYYALRNELYAYLESVADKFDLRRHITFGAEATSAEYDEDGQRWTVRARGRGGASLSYEANVVITAVGAFNKPKLPKVEGVASFEGPVAHTARWPVDGIDVHDKRVGVVGTGASAMQLVPAIVDDAARVIVFQRTPQWAAPFEKFKKPVPESVQHLLATVPLYYDWYRLRLAWTYNDAGYPALQKDPTWDHPDRSTGPINDRHREIFSRYITAELGDRQDLLDKVLPTYPPYGKRMLMDNGWFRTMTRDDVELVTQAVAEVRSQSVVTVSGAEYEVDVLVWATGFDVVHFLVPIDIRGRDGRDLHAHWGDDARAYLGTTIPGFPNLFCLYGPNAQFGHGGSLITIMDRQMHYVMSVLTQMFEAGAGAVEIKADVHDRYNAEVDARHENLVWTHPGMDNYYRNGRGRVVAINPFRVVEFWGMTEHADLGEYHVEPAR